MPRDVDYIVEGLEEWGADVKEVIDSGHGETAVDFVTPFPGNQPIWSSYSVKAGMIVQATVRYGVLDGSKFPRHPSNSPDQLDRLKDVARRSNMPDVGVVLVNYGDAHREPRPHLLLGWRPSVAEDEEVLVENDSKRRYPPEMVLDVTKRFGQNVRREFRGEWAND